MRILLDTNIFIHRETFAELPEKLQELQRLFSLSRVQVLIHPLSYSEIQRDANEERRKIHLSKLSAYPLLDNPPIPKENDAFIISEIGKKINHYIDKVILFAVYKDAVELLITEDKELISKASRYDLQKRVLNISDALSFFKQNYETKQIFTTPAVKEIPLYNIDYSDSILNQLKEEYPDFQAWWKKISKEGRKAWVHKKLDGSLGAILILKPEEQEIHATPSLPFKKRLKICTLIVTHNGFKIGELFLKVAFDFAVNNNIEEVYLTHFVKNNDFLVELVKGFGFKECGRKDSGESIFLKEMKPPTINRLDPKLLAQEYYPSYVDSEHVNKFIIPIRSHFHDRLFVSYRFRRNLLFDYSSEFRIEGNTIVKAYLCHARIKKIRPGDLILFYRSRDAKCLTTLGVALEIYEDQTSPDAITRIVGKRTVYSYNEIYELAQKPTKVIIFQRHFHFPKQIHIQHLIGEGILSGAPQSIMQIDHDSYKVIKKIGKLDGRFAFN